MEKHPSGIKPESWLVSAGRASAPGAPLSVPPIPASNFILGSGREYSRDDGAPAWEALEEVVGGLEAGKAVAFASGLAAAGAERQRWSVRRVAVDDTASWIRTGVDADLVWLESPSNPRLTVTDAAPAGNLCPVSGFALPSNACDCQARAQGIRSPHFVRSAWRG